MKWASNLFDYSGTLYLAVNSDDWNRKSSHGNARLIGIEPECELDYKCEFCLKKVHKRFDIKRIRINASQWYRCVVALQSNNYSHRNNFWW